MDNAGVLPTKLLVVHGVSIGYVHQVPGGVSDAADRDRIRYNGVFRWRIIDKDILILPLIAIPEVNPLGVASTTVNASTVLGVSQPGMLMYSLPIPITIEPYQNFSITLDFQTAVALATAANSMDIYMFLHGFLRRPT